MVLFQQSQNVPANTCGDFSECILSRILQKGDVVYFVTDKYNNNSIKGYERKRRQETGSMRYTIERRDQKKPKQWTKYLKDPENKTELVKFLHEDWSHQTRFYDKLHGKVLYVNVDDSIYKVSCVDNKVTIWNYVYAFFNIIDLINSNFDVLKILFIR